jgi:hypothetical protein
VPVGARTPPPDPPLAAPPVLEVVVEVPPPVVGVVFAGVVVAGVVVAAVVAAEELVEVVTEPLSVDPAAPVPEVAPVEFEFEPEPFSLSKLLLVSVGVIGTVVLGTSSETFVPPQAAIAAAPSTPPSATSDRRDRRVTRSRSGRTHATATGRAVVEVALGELLTPRAEAQGFDRPRQLRARRSER